MRALAFSIVTLLTLATNAIAIDDKWTRATLKGIHELEVSVGVIGSEAGEDGLSESALQTDVELRLRQAGLRVAPTPNVTLWVKLLLHKHRAGLYAYSIGVELYQGVSLVREPSILVLAPTWSIGKVGTVGDRRVATLRDTVRDLVDWFLNAYLSVNLKP